MKKAVPWVLGSTVALGVLLWWIHGVNPWRPLEQAETWELYSLSPEAVSRDEEEGGTEYFQGHPVLGTVQVTDPAQLQNLLAALRTTPAEDEVLESGFDPRYGIRVAWRGKTVDYLVSFACGELKVIFKYSANRAAVSGRTKLLFDRPLIEARIPVSAN